MKTITNFIGAIFTWIGGVFSEPDGKPSFSRVFGSYVVYQIVSMAETGAPVSSEMMTVFWVLIGYQMVSKFTPGMKVPGMPAIASTMVQETATTAAVTSTTVETKP